MRVVDAVGAEVLCLMQTLEIVLVVLLPIAALVVTAVLQRAAKNAAALAESKYGRIVAVLLISRPRSLASGSHHTMVAVGVVLGLIAIPVGIAMPGWEGLGVTAFGLWCFIEPWFVARCRATGTPGVVLHDSGVTYPFLGSGTRYASWSAINSIDERDGQLVLLTRNERIEVAGLDAESRQRVAEEWRSRRPNRASDVS